MKNLKKLAANIVGLRRAPVYDAEPEVVAEIISSGFFDRDLYARSAGIVFDTAVAAVEHYLLIGEKSGFKPHLGFDPVIYAALHPDLNHLPYPLIVHYIRHGQHEGRAAAGEGEVLSGNVDGGNHAIEIASSPFFDANLYSENAGTAFISDEVAAEHYLTHGEMAGLRPHKSFDPVVYRLSNPDLEGLPYPLLLHFIRHGREEGRSAAFDLDDMLLPGLQNYDPSRESILVGVHDLSRTGAPILALNLIRRLGASMNVICVAAHGGSMIEDFRSESVLLAAPRDGWLQVSSEIVAQRLILPLKARYSIAAAVVNSIEAAVLASGCYLAGLPVVSLVHEFADYVFPPEKIPAMMGHSQRVIFSSNLTERSMRDVRMVGRGLRNTTVLPQGKSDLPSDEPSSDMAPNEIIEGMRAAGKFVVVGCGHVQIRKGVDLFIAVAARLTAILGKDKVQFLWVGDGYAPDVPGDYSGWLKSQIERSELGDAFRFMPAVKLQELEALYSSAGALFLSSRLDPFPNVAIDAFEAGLPVVCFEQASGVAEYLQRFPELSGLVVPFFGINEAADSIVKLATDSGLRQRVSEKLKCLAKQEFNFEKYADRIAGFIEEAKLSHQIEIDDAHVIEYAEFFHGGVSWIGEAPVSRSHLIREYVRLEASGAFPAAPRPFPGFSPHVYAERTGLHGRQNALADWIREGRPKGPWKRDVLRLMGGDEPHDLKVALHIHLHFPEMIFEFLQRLALNATLPDLYLTTTSEESVSRLLADTATYDGNVAVRLVPNVGRDIASMFTELSNDLQAYDLVGHLHGKRSSHISSAPGKRDFVTTWREFLLENLLGGRTKSLDAIASHFAGNERLGMIFPEDPFICGWGRNRNIAESLAGRIGLGDLPDAIEFPVGDMFYFRPKALAPLFATGFSNEDFPVEPLPDDGTVLHALERLTPLVCSHAGFSWLTTEVEGITR